MITFVIELKYFDSKPSWQTSLVGGKQTNIKLLEMTWNLETKQLHPVHFLTTSSA